MEGNIAYQEEYLLAGQLAAAADVSTDTLRHYECKGVLTRPKRASNGYRLYPVEALTRVRLVQRALSAGFTLDELALVLNERDKGGVPCRDVYRLLTAKLSDFEGQLQALTALCDELRKTLSDWDTRLERMGPDRGPGCSRIWRQTAVAGRRKMVRENFLLSQSLNEKRKKMTTHIDRKHSYLLVPMAILVFSFAASAQQNADKKAVHKTDEHADCPMMKETEEAVDGGHSSDAAHHADVMKNGEKEMGFSQTATTHHFLIMKDGGAIQVEANDRADQANRNKIRAHMKMIAAQFTDGVFTTPFAVHGQVPPGVPVMDQRKQNIRYEYEETKNGARVRITTGDTQALAAIHEFLKFQIEEHRTGDPLDAAK